MEKQVECAAAISSSGLVLPLALLGARGPGDVVRAEPEDSSVTLPAPSKRVPSQWVLAVRVVAMC